MLWMQYCVTLDKVLPLFKPPHPPCESKKTKPEHDTLPKTVWGNLFLCLALFVVGNGET